MTTLFIDYRLESSNNKIPLKKVLIGNLSEEIFCLLQTDKISVKKTISGVNEIQNHENIIIILNDKTKSNFLCEKLSEQWPEKSFTPLSDASVISLFSEINLPSPESVSQNLRRSFSFILPNLYISDMYHAQNENLLNPLNITAIVNAAPSMAPNKFEDETNFTYLTVPIADSSETNIKAYFNLTNKFIDKYIKERGVLVHCAAGISRSATIIIAYVMYNLKMKSEDAFRFVNERHPIAYPNFGFCLQLIEYEKELAL